MTTTTESDLFTGLLPGRWVADLHHSEVAFTVRHLMSKVRGKFEAFDAAVHIGDELEQSSATATIDLSSVATGNTDRDNHLRSSDFFSVEETPTMSFTGHGDVQLDGERCVLSGDLTIRDITKPVKLDVEFLGVGPDPWGGTRAGFEARTTLSRKDWGINFNVPVEGDRLMIGDRIDVSITIEAVHQPDEA